MSSQLKIFLFIFLLGSISHTIRWSDTKFFDQPEWITETVSFAEHSTLGRNSLYYGYPATPFLLLNSALHFSGLPWPVALNLSLAALVSSAVAGIALLCYRLSPSSTWWIGAAGISLFHPLYMSSTPPSAIVAPFIALLVLFTLALYIHNSIPTYWLIIFGTLIGFNSSQKSL